MTRLIKKICQYKHNHTLFDEEPHHHSIAPMNSLAPGSDFETINVKLNELKWNNIPAIKFTIESCSAISPIPLYLYLNEIGISILNQFYGSV